MTVDDSSAATVAIRSLTTPGGTIRFTRMGSGPPVVLLHGLGGSQRAFSKLGGKLVEKNEIITVDLLGHGSSDMSAPDLSVLAQAGAINQLIDELRLDDITLVGQCLGGSVAIHAAAAHPDRVRRIVLLAAGCYEMELPISWRILRSGLLWRALGLLAPLRSWALHRAGRVFYGRPETMAEHLPAPALKTREGWAALGRAFRQSMSDSALSHLERLVDNMTVPALVIWGSDDRLVPAEPARGLFLEKRNVRFVEIAWGAHALLEEEAGIVNDLILEFLA